MVDVVWFQLMFKPGPMLCWVLSHALYSCSPHRMLGKLRLRGIKEFPKVTSWGMRELRLRVSQANPDGGFLFQPT